MAISQNGAKVAATVASSPSSTRNILELAVWEIEAGQLLLGKTIIQTGFEISNAQAANTDAYSMRVAFSPDNQQIMAMVGKSEVFVGDDIIRYAGSTLHLWNTANGESVQSSDVSRMAEDTGAYDFAMSPNGQFLALSYQSEPAKLVELWQRNQLGLFEYARTLPQEYGYWWGLDILFRNDGLLNVMTRSQDKALIATWNPQTGEQLTKINPPVHFPSDNNIRLEPDGDSYFAAGSSGSRLGSLRTGEVHTWPGEWAAFSDHGNYLAVINEDEVAPSISIYVKAVP